MTKKTFRWQTAMFAAGLTIITASTALAGSYSVYELHNSGSIWGYTRTGMAQEGNPRNTDVMVTKARAVLIGIVGFVFLSGIHAGERSGPPTPDYTADGQLRMPQNYREWIYLSSGFDMSYDPAGQAVGQHMFDNVFVNPESYKKFTADGKWPDKTMFVLELRGAESKGSINRNGNFQSTEVMGLEVHVKDSRQAGDGWAFFGFDGSKTARPIPESASCYSCHSAHGAVETTFVQFYPTLMPIARSKGSLSEAFLKEAGAATH